MNLLAQAEAAVAPYLAVIRIVLWAALVAALFGAGCRHGVATTRDEARATLAKSEQAANDNLAVANACGQTLSDITAATDAAKAEAGRRQAEAEHAADAALKATRQAKAQADQAAKDLAKAKAKPTCRAQLEMELCADIPLL